MRLGLAAVRHLSESTRSVSVRRSRCFGSLGTLTWKNGCQRLWTDLICAEQSVSCWFINVCCLYSIKKRGSRQRDTVGVSLVACTNKLFSCCRGCINEVVVLAGFRPALTRCKFPDRGGLAG